MVELDGIDGAFVCLLEGGIMVSAPLMLLCEGLHIYDPRTSRKACIVAFRECTEGGNGYRHMREGGGEHGSELR